MIAETRTCPLYAPKPHANAITGLAFHPIDRLLASGSGDGSIQLWDVMDPTSPRVIDRMTGPTDWITTIAFDPSGRLLASSGYDGAVWLWDVQRRRLLATPLEFHKDTVNSVVFTPDGETLISGSLDKNIAVWDLDFNSWKRRACSVVNRTLTDSEWQTYVGVTRDHEPCEFSQ